jgi:hypothetical protein
VDSTVNIEIAPNFTCKDWDALKLTLDPDGEWAACPPQWERAIKVFQARIEQRFFASIALLERVRYAGFAILALDCLLIETVQAFRNGKNARNTGESRNTHVAFLTGSPSFQIYFSATLAHQFFTNVRNGLLHDGETRNGWLIKATPKYALLDPQPGGFFVVNRRRFHAALIGEFEGYVGELRDPAQKALRKNLVAALDDLCKRSKP